MKRNLTADRSDTDHDGVARGQPFWRHKAALAQPEFMREALGEDIEPRLRGMLQGAAEAIRQR